MRPVLTSSDVVLLSYAESLLRDAEIGTFQFDEGISALQGGIGAFPRRLMVIEEDFDAAEAVLRAAGLIA